MKSIFLVTSGEYSDYSIHTACSTEQKAKEFIEKISGKPYEIEADSDSYSIEEFVIDAVDYLSADKKLYRIYMTPEGDLIEIIIYTEDITYANRMLLPFIRGYKRSSFHGGVPIICCYVYTTDENSAIKIAGEMLTQYLYDISIGIKPKFS